MAISLPKEIVLQAMGLKHDADLQGLAWTAGRFGHTMLLDPGDMGLRGIRGNREARLEAGLSDECERSLSRISVVYSQSITFLATLGEA
jgi:hypothetical protein